MLAHSRLILHFRGLGKNSHEAISQRDLHKPIGPLTHAEYDEQVIS
jgi:hypothetical protein